MVKKTTKSGNFANEILENDIFEKNLGAKELIQNLSKEIEKGELLDLQQLAQKHGMDTADVQKVLVEILKAPILSHEELSEQFTQLRNEIKIR
jgi:hypothetical protein